MISWMQISSGPNELNLDIGLLFLDSPKNNLDFY